MELKVESRVTSVGLKMIILVSAIITASLSQAVMTSMEPMYYSDPATASANLTCQFSVEVGTYTFNNLEWRIGGSLVADFFGGAAGPTYANYCVDSSGTCAITRTDSKSDFKISSLDMTKNEQTFSCHVTFLKGGGTINGEDSAVLVVVVPTNTIVMSNGSSSEAFTNGSEVELSLDVAKHIFQCVVAGINPNATFTWTVGSDQLTSNITESHVVDSGTGLTTSSSIATLTPNRDYNAQDLICKAVNYEGDPGVMFQLALKVADPCVGVECKNGGTCVINQNDPSMTKCECPVGYQGKLCETDTEKTTPPMRSLTTGAIVGIACAGLVLMVGTCVLVYCCCCGNKRKSDKPKEPHGDHESNTPMDTK